MSELERTLDARRFLVTAEMPVIDGGGVAEVRRQLEPMRPYVDAYNATDNPAAHAHASSLAVSLALLGAGAGPIMQLACRDRNRLALQADLVGAAMHGVENISCMSGDDVSAGDEPEARRVFDLDGPQLIALTRTLAGGRYLSGRALEPRPRFLIGAVENPSAPPLAYRVRRAAKKAMAGARFLQLQLCYRPELLERFMSAAHELGLTERIAIVPSICILRTVGGMRFVARSVPGIDVPAELQARVERAADPEHECFEVAYELASHARLVHGAAHQTAGIRRRSRVSDTEVPQKRRKSRHLGQIGRIAEDHAIMVAGDGEDGAVVGAIRFIELVVVILTLAEVIDESAEMKEKRRGVGSANMHVGCHRIGHSRLLRNRLRSGLVKVDLRRAGVANRMEGDLLGCRDRCNRVRTQHVCQIHVRRIHAQRRDWL